MTRGSGTYRAIIKNLTFVLSESQVEYSGSEADRVFKEIINKIS